MATPRPDGERPDGERAAAAPAGATAAPAAPEALNQPALTPIPAAAPPVDDGDRQALAHLDVRDTGNRFQADEPVTHGLPFPRGALEDAAALRAWRADDGAALPLQARTLSRWPDGSVRWALIDTRVDVPKKGRVRLAFGLADDLPAGDDPFTVVPSDDGRIVVSDGATEWTLLAPVEGGHEVLGLRADLVDRFEKPYRAVFDPGSLTLLERGPLRAVVRLTGEHRRLTEDGLEIPFHTVTVHAHLIAGRATALVEWSIANGPLEDPPGPLAFRDYSLTLAPPPGVTEIERTAGRTSPEQSVVMLQTSGSSTTMVADEPMGGTPKGDLWMGMRGDESSLHAHMIESAQNHPSSIGWQPGRGLVLGLLPAGTGQDFWLDDATRKTFRLHLLRDALGAGRERMARLENPAHPALDPTEVAASLAWGDAGHVVVPSTAELGRTPSPPRDAPTGWVDWGEALAKNTHQTGSPRSQLSVFLEAMQSGNADLFRWNRSRAWHAMDLRPYHIEGFDADVYPRANLYEGIPHPNEQPAIRLGRSEMKQRFMAYKADLPSQGHGYNGFDPEHMTLDDVYECWLLTGSWPALSALRSAGEAMLTWKELVPDGTIHSSRTFGWTLRALIQVWRATGEARYLDAARAYVARADRERGREGVKYLRIMKPDARHIADKEADDPWMVAVALHGLSAYWVETEDPIVPPMVTDLTSFCMSAFRGTGFLPDVPIDGSPPPGQPMSRGVSSWVPGGIAAAAWITGDHGDVDKLYGYYKLLFDDTAGTVRYGGQDWHWWQSWLASVSERYGRVAIADPKAALKALGGR